MRILVCDDHVLFADSLAHLLRVRGRDVVAVAHDPAAAVALLRGRPVDIALLDVSYGSDTVLNHLPELRRAAPATRVVLLCGQVDADLLGAARLAGVAAVADKRQPIDEILAILDRVHAGERLIPAAATAPVAVERAPVGTRPEAADAQWLAGFLTPREREVLSALVRGSGTAKLARSLGIAEATARCHVQAVLTKMGAHSRLEAATAAVRHGMVNPETGEWLVGTTPGGVR